MPMVSGGGGSISKGPELGVALLVTAALSIWCAIWGWLFVKEVLNGWVCFALGLVAPLIIGGLILIN